MSSLTKRKIPPRECLSYLNGEAYLSMINCDCGKEELSFVSNPLVRQCHPLSN